MDARPQNMKPGERLLQTATRLFCREGIRATGIDKILAEAGVAKMTLYNQFGSKEGLVFAVLDREGALWRSWFADALQRHGGTAAERLIAIFAILEEWFGNDNFYGCALINAVAEHHKDDLRIRDLALGHKMQVLAMIRALVEAAGCADVEGVSHAIGLLVDGAIINAVVSGTTDAARSGAWATRLILQSATPQPSTRANAA
ncbi:MAG: TetR/AcrR family transcriptional regulator [Azospirillaceae bacterium]|nr:TetR/AcrR family transcriptional regulator [Azospirillaceae bacterium]